MLEFPKRLMKISCKYEDFHFNLMYGKKFTLNDKNIVNLWNYAPIDERRKIINIPSNAIFLDAFVGVSEVQIGSKVMLLDDFVNLFNSLPKEVRRKVINENKNLFFSIY